ncbi:MAG: CshA/CshB family fibrillar adhesin-related protein [Saprospiraceae bacterium]
MSDSNIEGVRATTNGSEWQLLDTMDTNLSSVVFNHQIVFSNNNLTSYIQNGYRYYGLLSSTLENTSATNPLILNVDLVSIGGRTGCAIGLMIGSDKGDAPTSYGLAQHINPMSVNGGENTGTPPNTMYFLFDNPLLNPGVPEISSDTYIGTTPPDMGGYTGNETADADDNDLTDDEDAVIPGECPVEVPETGKFTVIAGSVPGTVTISIPLTLTNNNTLLTSPFNAWLDFDHNGVFDTYEAPTLVTDNANTPLVNWEVPTNSVVTNTFYWEDVSIASLGGNNPHSFFRVRISHDPITSADASDSFFGGEVEDHLLLIPTIFFETLPDQTITECSGTPFSFIPPNGDNLVPNDVTYTWSDPIVTGGMTGGQAETVPQTAVTGLLLNPTSSNQTATYNVTATTIDGCIDNFTLIVTVIPKPEAGPDQSICDYDESVTMAAVGTGTWTALTSNPNTTTITNANSPTTTITGFRLSGDYQYIWTVDGCSDTVIVTVSHCGNSWGCPNTGFLFQTPGSTGTDIISVDISTGNQVTLFNNITDNSTSINGVEYNVTDGELWGSYNTTPGLYTMTRVGTDGVVRYYYLPELEASGIPSFYIGTIDDDGIYYGMNYSSNAANLYRIDLNPSSLNYLTVLPTLTLTPAATALADFAYNPVDGFLYTISSTSPRTLLKINRITGATSTVGNVTSTDTDFATGAYGAAYMDANGNLYVGDNGTGKIFKISETQNITGNSTAQFRSQGQPSGGNDGALCMYACIKPDAGPDTTITCNMLSTSLNAVQVSGIEWQQAAGNPATVTFADPNNATTSVSGFTVPGTYNLIWSNGGVCNDTMQVIVVPKPDAGGDQSICQFQITNMTATGSGEWTQIGTNPMVVTIADINNPMTEVSGFDLPEIMVLFGKIILHALRQILFI